MLWPKYCPEMRKSYMKGNEKIVSRIRAKNGPDRKKWAKNGPIKTQKLNRIITDKKNKA